MNYVRQFITLMKLIKWRNFTTWIKIDYYPHDWNLSTILLPLCGWFHPWTPSKLVSHDINGVHHGCPMQIEKFFFSLWAFVVSFFKGCVLSSYFPFEFAKVEILELLGVCEG
jgi:hypothetical protein